MPERLTENISFYEKVYLVVQLVPYGKVTSYGAIARFLGTGQSARMVGWALNNSHTDILNIPAHRVVNRNGALSGKHHFGGPCVMQELLESEGIRIENDQVVNLEKHFWDPVKELL